MSREIEKIDKNLGNNKGKTLEGMDIYTPDSPSFLLTGLPFRKKGEPFHRFPEDFDLSFNPYLSTLATHTAGVALHFASDTEKVLLHAKVGGCNMTHMAQRGSMGFDLYVGRNHTQVFCKSSYFTSSETEYTSELFSVPKRLMREFTIYFPLYSSVKSVEIGLTPGAKVQPVTPFANPRPIVVYGTSITQGGCVSRPGMLYSNMLGRLLKRPCYNFGFSGNGKGEKVIAEKLSTISDAAMFILDYDDNARPALLEKTLKEFILTLRKNHPSTPIIALSTEPKSAEAFDPFDSNYASRERLLYTAIHEKVQQELREEGDDNIYFLDGQRLYGPDFDEFTVDGAHATDLGNYHIAHNLAPFAERILNRWW